jgi:hypothetical protein
MNRKLLSSMFVATGLTLTSSSSIFAETVIDFTDITGHGLSQNRIQINNIRVDQEIASPFDPSRPTIISTSYDVPFQFEPSTLRMVPDLGNAVVDDGSTQCANLSLVVSDAINGQPIGNASVNIGSNSAETDINGEVNFINLVATSSSITVSANGYDTITQNTTLSCTQPTSLGIALNSPLTLGNGEFRVILSWGENPVDLDLHLTGPGNNSTGFNDEQNRFHLFWAENITDVAVLDVDDVSSFGPETITVSPPSGLNTLRSGVYRYSVHHFDGSADLINSNAIVRLILPNGTERSFTPPAGSLSGIGDTWTVFEIVVDEETGNLSVLPVNTYGNNFDSGTVRSRVQTTTGYGEVEKNVDWGNLPAK